VTPAPAAGTLSGFEYQPGHGPSSRESGFHVANIKSQIKRNRQNEKRHARNKAVRSEIKTRTKAATAAAEAGADDVEVLARAAVKRLDAAASKGVIHKNAAARRKSRLMKRIAAAGSTD
jgi:small subunit ribosomal protein S20